MSAERRIGTDEDLITLTEAAKCLPKVNGKKPAVCTLWRWCRRGLRGISLDQQVSRGSLLSKAWEINSSTVRSLGLCQTTR